MAFNLGGAPPILDAEHMGIPNLIQSLQQGFNAFKGFHCGKFA